MSANGSSFSSDKMSFAVKMLQKSAQFRLLWAYTIWIPIFSIHLHWDSEKEWKYLAGHVMQHKRLPVCKFSLRKGPSSIHYMKKLKQPLDESSRLLKIVLGKLMLATQSSCMTLYGLVRSDYGTVQYQIWNCFCDQEWSDWVRPKTIVIGVFTYGAQ